MSGGHGGVHRGHLHLVVEIGAVAQAAHDNRRAVPRRGRNGEIVEGDHLDGDPGRGGQRLADGPQQRRALRRREDRRLGRVDADADHQPVDEGARLRDHVAWPLVTGSKVPV